MPELAAEMAGFGREDRPRSLSRWLLRHGYRYKKKRCWRRNKIAPT